MLFQFHFSFFVEFSAPPWYIFIIQGGSFMKKLLSVLICAVMLFALALPAFAEGTVTRMEASVTLPKAGDIYRNAVKLETAEPEKYSAVTDGMWYYGPDGYAVSLKDGDKIPAGKSVYFRIMFIAEPGYTIAKHGNGGVYVLNGKVIDLYYGDTAIQPNYLTDSPNLDKYRDVTPEDTGKNNDDEQQMNIFQRIAAFFSGIVEKIRLIITGLFPKV